MRHLMPLLAAGAAALIIGPADSLGDQLFKLLSDDGAAFDLFGGSVSISGTTAIIGARWDDNDNGPNAGSAYLFDTTTGVQIAKLLADDGAASDEFGVSVAIDGATAIVGGLVYNATDITTGSAYLFDISDPVNPVQTAKLLPNDGEEFDHFGRDVAISGTVAIVGARKDDDNGEGSGSAYIFDTTTGLQIAKLLPNDGAPFEYFGISVGICGATAIVGAAYDDDDGTDSGSAYLFDTTTGRQIAKLLPDDGAAYDYFGRSVAISGPTAIVGAPLDDDNGSDSGSAYLFDTTTSRQIAKFLSNDGASSDWFGRSVAISGNIAIVGAFRDDDNGSSSGSAYLFVTTTGEQIAKLLANDGASADSFGRFVAISVAPGSETAIVGAWWDDNDNGFNSGSAYLFDAAGTPTCPWDLHGDGIVGPGDLLILLGWWGFDPGGPPDFDGDGNVGASDLLALLANWGPCP